MDSTKAPFALVRKLRAPHEVTLYQRVRHIGGGMTLTRNNPMTAEFPVATFKAGQVITFLLANEEDGRYELTVRNEAEKRNAKLSFMCWDLNELITDGWFEEIIQF